MAYTRCGNDSDIYVYRNLADVWVCIPCTNPPSKFHTEDRVFTDLYDLRDHLLVHRYSGDKVPDHTFERIEKEMRDE